MSKLYIFDADSTLRRCTVPGQYYPHGPDQWRPIALAYQRLRQIDWRDNHFAIASNQGGVAKGYLTKEMAKEMLDTLAHVMVPRMPHLIAMCPHPSDGDCECRKPKPGMLNALMAYHKTPPARTMFVGDMDTDKMAANSAGIEFAWIWDFCGVTREAWQEHVGYL
jgi:D-glycero-D-manno-heptose 1,7-bisphosphate phosphatase